MVLTQHPVLQGDRSFHTSSLLSMARARAFDQNLSHRSCGNGKKMGTVLPLQILVTQQPQIGFMNQCRGLQGLPVAFPTQVSPGEPAQFLVNNGKQLR